MIDPADKDLFRLALIGAITIVCLGIVALVIVWGCARHYYKARLWDRYARACGGHARAMEVLVIAEKLQDEEQIRADLLLRRGFTTISHYERTH